MAFVKNSVNGYIILRARDGAGANVDLTVPYDLGDVAVSNLAETLNQVVTFQRRGKWVSDGHGERIFPGISFTSYHMGYQDQVQEFLFRQGATYGSLVSVQGAGRPWAIDFILGIEGTAGGDADDWETTFANCPVLPASFNEAMDGDKWALSLECKGAVSGDLTLAEIA